mgnify:CR=1 FL=1
MSDINRIQGNFRGLVVQNKNNNILKMDQAGNFSLSTKTIENISYQKIINISEDESIYTAKKNNLVLSEGDIVLGGTALGLHYVQSGESITLKVDGEVATRCFVK